MFMLDLNDFRYFVEVVDRKGFSAASRSLGIPVSTLSYRIARLEQDVGLWLLERTSRTLSMTEAGAELYGHAVVMLESVRDGQVAISQRLVEPAGRIRYTAAIAIAQHVLPHMTSEFLARHPKVFLEEHAGDQFVDLISARYDLAIRAHTGPLANSLLVQRPLADVPWHLFASPSYLAARGRPEAPFDLANHSALFMIRGNTELAWNLAGDEEKELRITPSNRRMLAACTSTLKAAAVDGVGIVSLPAYICREEVRAGALTRVLPRWLSERSTITALLPNRRGMLPAMRAFLDHLVNEFPKAVGTS